MGDIEILDVNETSLDEWIELIRKPPVGKIFIRNMFPTEAHRSEWFQTAHSRSESDVKLLLRHFLVSTGSNRLDADYAKYIYSRIRGGASVDNLQEHDRRLLLHHVSGREYPVWEGLGWVIDLLPHFPRMALNVIDAFFHACWYQLTDNYVTGLFDSKAIIRNRYIESSHTADGALRVLLSLDWRELEWLCGVVYEHMGFEVMVTPPGNDDGVDVFATIDTLGQKGLVVIQAKKWSKSKRVGKAEIDTLLGTIFRKQATKGVLVTTGRCESGAIKMADQDPRIELLGREKILRLLNEHCGADWFTRADRLITSIQMKGRTRH